MFQGNFFGKTIFSGRPEKENTVFRAVWRLGFWKNYLWTSLSFSYSLQITCILLRQVIFFSKRMVVLSVKFTILNSCSPICIPLILLSALRRLTQCCITAWDSWHHWRKHIGVKGSDRRPLLLVLDSILVYATWMNLSPKKNYENMNFALNESPY